MSDLAIASIISATILLASTVSIELGISAAIIEMSLGVLVGNVFGIHPTAWLTFIASFGGILLTFLAGTEVDVKVMRENLKESILIGGISFIAPFALAFAFAYFGAHWSLNASKITGIALSTTSLAVVYAVLVESGLTNTKLGKIIMASTFVTDLLTVTALSIVFFQVNIYTLVFYIFSLLLLVFSPKLIKYFFKRYNGKVIEPEIKLLFFVFFISMFLAQIGDAHAELPIFILGLLLSTIYAQNPHLLKKFRTVGFALITPFFFIKGGMNVGISDVLANSGLLVLFLLVKLGAKVVSVYPVTRWQLPSGGRVFLTLLMSTGLTFGTISSVFGFQSGYIDKAQFSILITTVILSAIVPTIIAQRFFAPLPAEEKELLLEEGEEG